MTKTQIKREKRAAKYAQKDARKAIYAMLFGPQEYTYLTKQERKYLKRSNVPEDDETRQLSSFWDPEAAQKVFDEFIDLAAFTPERKAELAARLLALKNAYRRKQMAE